MSGLEPMLHRSMLLAAIAVRICGPALTLMNSTFTLSPSAFCIEPVALEKFCWLAEGKCPSMALTSCAAAARDRVSEPTANDATAMFALSSVNSRRVKVFVILILGSLGVTRKDGGSVQTRGRRR